MSLEQSNLSAAPLSASAAQSGPMVMVYIGDDDPSRGDSHGFKGIGQRMAQKLGGRFHYIEDKHLSQLYPGYPRREDALEQYMKQHGKPDILLGRGAYYGMMTSINARITMK